MDTNMPHEKNLQETICKYGQGEWKNRDAAFHSYLAHIFCDDFQENIFFLSDCTDYEFSQSVAARISKKSWMMFISAHRKSKMIGCLPTSSTT